MNNMRFCRKLTAVFLIICICLGATQIFASNSQTVADYDDVFSKIIVLKYKQPYYFDCGVKTYFNSSDKGYFPQYKDNEMYVSVVNAKNILRLNSSYDTASETFTFSDNTITVKLRIGEDTAYINSKPQYIDKVAEYNGTSVFMPVKTLSEVFGKAVYENNNIIYIGDDDIVELIKDNTPALERYAERFVENVMFNDFDSDLPANFYDWGAGSSRAAVEHGWLKDSSQARSGNNYVYVDAVPSAFAGYRFDAITTNEVSSWDVSCYAKTDGKYNANNIAFGALLYKDEKCVKVITANAVEKEFGESWTRFSTNFASYDFMNIEFDRFYPAVLTLANGVKEDNPATGRVYFDDFSISRHQAINGNIQAEFISDNEASWYKLGDKVTYICTQPDKLSGLVSITQKVYDIDNQLVYSVTKPISAVKSGGFTYIPDEIGYYETEFIGTSRDGSTHKVVCSYGRKINQIYCDVDLERRSFVVVRSDSKPMEERSDFNRLVYGFDFNGNTKEADRILGMADKIGFSGLQTSARWGETPTTTGFHLAPGKFDFTRTDLLLECIEKYGFKNITWGFSVTPRWAAPADVPDGTNVAAMYIKNVYAPAKWEYLEEGIKGFMEHYKGKVKELQIWNEPYYGNARTAYWYDTKENFEELTIRAASAAKSVDPDVFIWSAGHLGGSNGVVFLDDILNNKEFANSIDGITYHGSHNIVYAFSDVIKRHGLDVPYANCEAYPYRYGYQTYDVPKDYARNNMYFLLDYFYALKGGADSNTMFVLTEDTNQAEKLYGSKNIGYGFYTRYPYFEPRSGAVIAHTFFNLMGKDFTYDAEYNFGDNKAVVFNNDGKKTICLWNAKDRDFAMPEELASCLTENSKIMDFEGKYVEGTNLEKLKMYYITEVDEQKLAQIKKSDNEVINQYAVAPYYTCESKIQEPIKDVSNLDVPRANNSADKPFDEHTFEVADEVEWIEDGWEYIAIGGNEVPENYNVRSAFHIDNDGLYMMLDVTEDAFVNNGSYEEPGNMYMFDSVQFAFDTIMANDNSQRIECQIGLTPEGELMYKQNAPDIGAMLPAEYTPQGKTMDKKNLRIEKTATGTLYKIFVPMSELFTYTYPGTVDYCRLSVLVNENNGTSRIGYCQWGSGIGGKKDVSLYGILNLNK